MLKRIGTDQLILGMYIHEFCGSWLDHPFVRVGGFLLSNPKDLDRVHGSSIREVWIDVSKGKDIPAHVKSVSREEADAEIEARLSTFGELPPEPAAPPIPKPPTVNQARLPASMAEETHRARAICDKAKGAVTSMFKEARMGRAINSDAANELVSEISDSVARNSAALISLARLKTADDYTYMHSVAVCALMVSLAMQMKLGETITRQAAMAGLLHDVGKALMPMEVLNKPGKLTDAEFAIIRGHPRKGYEMLRASPQVSAEALDVCLHHHEKFDGSGYPDRLKGDSISLLARMGAVCDVYDAITSNRPYKSGWDPAQSIRRMAEWAPGHFDALVFQAFVKSIGIYPVGSLVRMASGRLGVVVAQNPTALTAPMVKVFYSTKSNLRIPPEVIDLSKGGPHDRIASREDPAVWKFHDLDEIWSGIQGAPW